jgi:hypothetical protein
MYHKYIDNMKVLGGLRLIERDADTEEVIRVIEKRTL